MLGSDAQHGLGGEQISFFRLCCDWRAGRSYPWGSPRSEDCSGETPRKDYRAPFRIRSPGATEDDQIKTGDDLDVWEHRLEERVAADTSIGDTMAKFRGWLPAGVASTASALSFKQWPTTEVVSVKPQQIERVEMLRPATTHQIVELRNSVLTDTNYFTVQDRVTHCDRSRYRFREFRERFVEVPIAGDEPSFAILDVGHSPKPIKLLENPGWSKGTWSRARGIGVIRGSKAPSV